MKVGVMVGSGRYGKVPEKSSPTKAIAARKQKDKKVVVKKAVKKKKSDG